MSIKKQYEPRFKTKLAIELISDKKNAVETLPYIKSIIGNFIIYRFN